MPDDVLKQKPPRPFGVTLAIGVSVLFFSIIPLMTVGMRFALETYILDSTSDDGVVVGTDSPDPLTDTDTLIQLGISVGFLGIAFFSWRGRPRWMRFALMISVVVIAAVLLVQAFNNFQGSALEGGSVDSLIHFLRQGQILFLILIPLYVVWYLNRAPARAFYRGYYLQEDMPYIVSPDDLSD